MLKKNGLIKAQSIKFVQQIQKYLQWYSDFFFFLMLAMILFSEGPAENIIACFFFLGNEEVCNLTLFVPT